MNDSRQSASKRRRLIWTLGILAVAALTVRAALPWAVATYVNDKLDDMGDYSGRVAEVDISLLRGAYVIHDLVVVKTDADVDEPFFAAPTTDISVQWPALFQGAFVGELLIHDPVLNFVQGESAATTQTGAGTSWPETVRSLFPFRLNRLAVEGGAVTFRAPGIESNESLTIQELGLLVSNLTNAREKDREAFTEFSLNGRVIGGAPLAVSGRIDPNESDTTFDLNVEFEDAELTAVNPWLEEFLKIDAESGTFSLFAELATADGNFKGYLQPILEDADIFELEEVTENPLSALWDGLVGLAAAFLTNPSEDQVATRIPYEGELSDPDADSLATIANLLRNAFVAAFTHAIQGSVDIEDVDEPGGDTPDE